MKRSDAIWLLMLPVYMALDTLRHEASHALAGWLFGGNVLEIHFLPNRNLGHFSFGYTVLTVELNWLILGAPFIVDMIVFAMAFWLCLHYQQMPRWLWVNVVILGMFLPALDTYQAWWGSQERMNDAAHLLKMTSPWLVHGCFLLALRLYAIGILIVWMQRAPKPMLRDPLSLLAAENGIGRQLYQQLHQHPSGVGISIP